MRRRLRRGATPAVVCPEEAVRGARHTEEEEGVFSHTRSVIATSGNSLQVSFKHRYLVFLIFFLLLNR